MMRRAIALLPLFAAAGCGTNDAPDAAEAPRVAPAVPVADDPSEPHLANVRQLTFGGENAEAYWSWDGSKLILQVRERMGFQADQIVTMGADGSGERLVSTGKGRTTCAYFLPGDRRVLYASTHHRSAEIPVPAKADPGVYAWPIFDYDVFTADPDGSNLVQITDTPAYDAEATVAPDGTIVFTSSRTGDLEIFTMRPDGSDVKQLTHEVGYDGGPFFSLDGKRIVYRSHHPTSEADVAKYKDLLARGLVQPTKMSLWVMDADGSNKRRVTDLPGASFGPFLRRAGEKIIFSSNWEQPRGPEFDLWLVAEDGTGLERVTTAAGFDGFPMFSPDGTKLVWCSNRQGGKPHETNVFVADWIP
jgi:dipeptidyl aminopeptidase/acylaminoacyl peptidase